jgi:hypothetical protein
VCSDRNAARVIRPITPLCLDNLNSTSIIS